MKFVVSENGLPDTQATTSLAVGGMSAEASWVKRHVVLVKSADSGAESQAVQWADQIARSAGLRLRVVFCTPVTASEPADPASIELLVEHILRESAQEDVELLVIEGLPSERGAEQAAVAQSLLRRCQRPILFVGSRVGRPLVMAATDCSDPALPVLRVAWQMAAVTGSQIVLVHNIDEIGSQFAERIGMPLSPELADVLAVRSREWLENAAAVGDVLITRDISNAQGVLSAAQRVDC
ncbi:MAG TPA: universal stress protein, partial [Pseudomonadota bacterium]|nr:universal stress protein [Pseudomonadota bacterium]